MADNNKKHVSTSTATPVLARPEVGTILTILSGLFFLLLGMLLPLVGKAGVQTPHYGKNFAMFLTILLITLVLSGLSIKSKLDRRAIDQSPRPWLSIMIGTLSLLLLVALFTGLLKI